MFAVRVDEEIELAIPSQTYTEKMFNLIDKNRDYLLQWLAWPAFVNQLADSELATRNMLMAYAEGKSLPCYIIYKGELVGVAGFNTIDHSLKKVDVGYWLSAEYQGKGIVGRACRALCDYAFNELAMDKVQVSVAEGNKTSRTVCEKLGMTLEGVITNAENINGRIVDHAIYGLQK